MRCPNSHAHRRLIYVKYGVRSPKFIWAPVYSCTHWMGPRNTPHPPVFFLGSYTRALLVNQDRRHLFVTPWGDCFLAVQWETPTCLYWSSTEDVCFALSNERWPCVCIGQWQEDCLFCAVQLAIHAHVSVLINYRRLFLCCLYWSSTEDFCLSYPMNDDHARDCNKSYQKLLVYQRIYCVLLSCKRDFI